MLRVFLFGRYVDGSEKNLIFLFYFYFTFELLKKTLGFLAFRVALKKAEEYFSMPAVYLLFGGGGCSVGCSLGTNGNFGISPSAPAVASP